MIILLRFNTDKRQPYLRVEEHILDRSTIRRAPLHRTTTSSRANDSGGIWPA